MREKVLEVNDLKISFKTQAGILQAIRGINFELYRGETLAIVGESGSGKSVTSRAIMGLLAGNSIYESGEILYSGKDLTKMTEELYHEIRGSKIAMVFQDPMSSLNPIIKIGTQIEESLKIKLKMPKNKIKDKAIELMREVGIPNPEKRYHQYPYQFSGGMRQRIVIAIALANNAEILIFDEPTTALDVTIQAQILELVAKIKKERNLSIIFVTHDLGVVASIADRVAVMYAGKIVEYGNVNEIFYNSQHPYTWALLQSMPDLSTKAETLDSISGTPPNMVFPPKGDAFAQRNKYAMEVDFKYEPPLFKVSPTHYAATWLLDRNAPKIELPKLIKKLREKGGFPVEK